MVLTNFLANNGIQIKNGTRGHVGNGRFNAKSLARLSAT